MPAAMTDDEYRTTQLRIIKALAAVGAVDGATGLDAVALAKRAGVVTRLVYRYVGPVEQSRREGHDRQMGFRCLMTRGVVKAYHDPENDKYVFFLSAYGQRVVEKLGDRLETLGRQHAGPGSKRNVSKLQKPATPANVLPVLPEGRYSLWLLKRGWSASSHA